MYPDPSHIGLPFYTIFEPENPLREFCRLVCVLRDSSISTQTIIISTCVYMCQWNDFSKVPWSHMLQATISMWLLWYPLSQYRTVWRHLTWVKKDTSKCFLFFFARHFSNGLRWLFPLPSLYTFPDDLFRMISWTGAMRPFGIDRWHPIGRTIW